MKINAKLLPIKLHFFLFMAALGPILPQLPLFGKDLGISPVVMGTVTGTLPFTFLLTKPLFGLLVDVFRQYRKSIFMFLILIMTVSFGGIYFIPTSASKLCDSETLSVSCNISKQMCKQCSISTSAGLPKSANCSYICHEKIYESFTFWTFIIFLSVGTIGFNVVNSISDAICFDVVVKNDDYGKQRLWGSIGFGLTGLLSGYFVDIYSKDSQNYTPAYILMFTLSVMDLFICTKLQLPVIEAPRNIFRDLGTLFANNHVIAFITFTVLLGILDSTVIYFLFWYLEDLAQETSTTNVKLIEGLILAAETLGAEVLFFFVSGKILERLGHVHSFTLCFFNYFLRLGLIALAPTPWWFLPIELFMQGPTFALSYTAIVAYANEVAPPGLSATVQGIAAGMGDGTGYAIGSIIGGVLYRYVGGSLTFQIFAGLAGICAVLHFTLHRTILKSNTVDRSNYEVLE